MITTPIKLRKALAICLEDSFSRLIRLPAHKVKMGAIKNKALKSYKLMCFKEKNPKIKQDTLKIDCAESEGDKGIKKLPSFTFLSISKKIKVQMFLMKINCQKGCDATKNLAKARFAEKQNDAIIIHNWNVLVFVIINPSSDFKHSHAKVDFLSKIVQVY